MLADENAPDNADADGTASTAALASRSKQQNQPSAATTRYSLRKRNHTASAKNGAATDNNNKGNNENANHEGDNDADDDDDASATSEYSHDDFGYVNSTTLTDHDLESLLRRHEADGIRDREEKRRRLDPYPYVPPEDGGGIIPLDHLPSPCIELVFEMLPTCRGIFNLAFLSKTMLSHVERRSEIIVRTAVMEGRVTGGKKAGSANRIATQLVGLVRNRAIHVPSPLRILRLVCSTRCERGEECWDYNIETGHASPKLGVQGAARPFGLVLCKKCTEDAGRGIPNWWNHWVRNEDRVITVQHSKLFHPNAASDLLVTADGQKVGPVLNARHILQICTTYKYAGVERQKEAYAALIDEVYGKEGDEKYDTYEKAASSLVECFDDAEAALAAFHERKKDESAANRKELIARKKEAIAPIIEILEESCEGLPEDIKGLAMDFEWREDMRQPLRFAIPFVNLKLEAFTRAPSYATQKRVDEAVAAIRSKLDVLASHPDFYTYAFLDSDASAPRNKSAARKIRIKQKILNYCNQNLSSLPQLAGRDIGGSYYFHPPNYLEDAVLDQVEKGRYMTALLRILDRRRVISNIVQKVLVAESSSDLINHRRLAGVCWAKFDSERSVNRYRERDPWTSGKFYETLSRCRTEFFTLKRNAREYLSEKNVTDWLANQPPNQGNWNNFTRQDAVDAVFSPSMRVLRPSAWGGAAVPPEIKTAKPYHLLLSRDFANLLKVHKYYFSRRSTTVH